MRPKDTTVEIKDANRAEGRSSLLAEFISTNIEPILTEWDSFAKKISPNPKMDQLALRDHAAQILEAIILDMKSAQTNQEQTEKSEGDADEESSPLIQTAAEIHSRTRLESGFDMLEMVAEYRALRASVIRLWLKTEPTISAAELEALSRFNEAIDQSLTMAMERYTAQVDRSRQIFLGILGHDLRSPLAAISMNAYVMRQYGNLDEKTAATASNIRLSANAMAEIIDDLLDFAGTQLGVPMPMTIRATELSNLCREVIDEVGSEFPKSRFNLLLPANEVKGHWDRARIRQMLSNLLTNACQHGSGLTEVHVAADDDDVQLIIRNEGQAISPETLPIIFEPLSRDSSEAEGRGRVGSLGLGLYIVREVVHGHHGTIDVESSEEAGTAFTIHLPRHAKA